MDYLVDNAPSDGSESPQQAFSMSGDENSEDVEIPSVFMLRRDAQRLRHLLSVSRSTREEMFVLLTWIRKEGEGEEEERGGEEEGGGGGLGSLFDSGEWTEDRTDSEQYPKSSTQSSSSDNNNSSH